MSSVGAYVGNASIHSAPNVPRAIIGQNGTAEFMNYPGYNTTHGVDINDSNWVAGIWLDDTGQFLGFRAKAFDDEFYPLESLPGPLNTFTRAMNNAGDIVGVSNDRAVLWPAGSLTPIDFNTLVDLPGETLVEAMDINNAGQILARGFNGYYIFTPIPEPAAIAAGSGLVAFVFRRPWRPRQMPS
jgi:hypothetical protein